MRAKQAGRLGWSLEQTLSVAPEIAALCERFGWRGGEGFARIRAIPTQSVRDFLAIAELEAEKERRAN